MIKNKKDLINIPKVLILISIIFLVAVFIILFITDGVTSEYCETYNKQDLTSTRVPLQGGETEYALNGSWVKETDLLNSCKFMNKKWDQTKEKIIDIKNVLSARKINTCTKEGEHAAKCVLISLG